MTITHPFPHRETSWRPQNSTYIRIHHQKYLRERPWLDWQTRHRHVASAHIHREPGSRDILLEEAEALLLHP